MSDFDPQALLQLSKKRQLRHGEVEALSLYIRRLEREVEAAQTVRQEAASDRAVLVALADDGVFAVTFPGHKPHTVRCAREPLSEFLYSTLRQRQGKPTFVGTGGAPTQADLEALARASKKKPSVKPMTPASPDLTLSDLGL